MSTTPTLQEVAVAEQTVRALALSIIEKFQCRSSTASLTVDSNGDIRWAGYQPGVWVGIGYPPLRTPAEVLEEMPSRRKELIRGAKATLATLGTNE